MTDDNTKQFFADLNKIKPDGGGKGAIVQEVLVTIPVRKPRRFEFIRTSPDPAMWQETTIFVDEGDRNGIYYVPPEMRSTMLGATKDVVLVPTVTAQRALLLWPLNLALQDGRQNYWTESALEAAEIGKTTWLRVSADMSVGAYRIFTAENAEALKPDWPEMPLTDLLTIAFKGRIIDRPDHPIVQRLRSPV